jgi:hypothetical protein
LATYEKNASMEGRLTIAPEIDCKCDAINCGELFAITVREVASFDPHSPRQESALPQALQAVMPSESGPMPTQE